ncbi:MAG: ATP-dependent DNA helicase RecG [Weeksellaceae bacterium]
MLDQAIETLPRTSPVTIKKLKNLNIQTFEDLLYYPPFRYEELNIISTIARAQPGETVTIKGTITKLAQRRSKRGMMIQIATLTDETGSMDLMWFNQRFLLSILKKDMQVAVAGTVELEGSKRSMKPVKYEQIRPDGNLIHTGRFVPVYPQSYGMSTKTLREKMWHVVNQLKDDQSEIELYPTDVLKQTQFIALKQALIHIHFPETPAQMVEARKRLSFDEVFVRMLSSQMVRQSWEKESITHAFAFDNEAQQKIETFIANLPFQLTQAQEKVVVDILSDLKRTVPMNRFLQGDVGSGKTVVAAIASYAAYLHGFQTFVMAPTEILAQQHYRTMQTLFEPMGITVGLQTGSVKAIKKNNPEISNVDVMIGTHALLTQHVKLDKVGLVIIDEQHRFGVRQRAILKDKGLNPHLLTMTATPIPRTVSLTIYSELDLSVIDEMPKGRLPIKTHVVPQGKRDSSYEWIKQQIKNDKIQVFIVCPLVEASEAESMQTVKAATIEFEHLKNDVFKNYRLALLHGRMKPKEKNEVMQDFKDKKYDVLVTTAVVEVGIDVPNATIMMIEGAERFGLAQLHQLRGRVGRGDKQSYCFLMATTQKAEANERLKIFSSTNSGMELAQYDLEHRGPGDIYGTQQSGYTDLQFANLGDTVLIESVQKALKAFTAKYRVDRFPQLQKRIEKYQLHQIARD